MTISDKTPTRKPTKILIIDNYDSFTYNLYQLCGEILIKKSSDFVLDVIRNDELSFEDIQSKNYDKIIISPGAGNPQDESYFGVCAKVILELGKSVPVLGICLGMQGICHYFGGSVVKSSLPKHGKVDQIEHNASGLFAYVSQDTVCMRYHSLICTDLPECLVATATVKNHPELLMGLRHKTYPIFGLQFHPESFATEEGVQMIKNFLEM
jgi:anthranilate synthase component 2